MLGKVHKTNPHMHDTGLETLAKEISKVRDEKSRLRSDRNSTAFVERQGTIPHDGNLVPSSPKGPTRPLLKADERPSWRSEWVPLSRTEPHAISLPPRSSSPRVILPSNPYSAPLFKSERRRQQRVNPQSSRGPQITVAKDGQCPSSRIDKRGGAQHLQYTRQNGIGHRDQEDQKNPLVHPASRL